MDSTFLTFKPSSAKLGTPIPPDSPQHAVSVTLPTWSDNIKYEEGDPAVHKELQTGYPRFVYHKMVRTLMNVCERKFARDGESVLVLPSSKAAEQCREFIKSQTCTSDERIPIRIVELALDKHQSIPVASHSRVSLGPDQNEFADFPDVTLYIVVFPERLTKVAKQFWQHSGAIISSRKAEYCLRLLSPTGGVNVATPTGSSFNNQLSRAPRYFAKGPSSAESVASAREAAASERNRLDVDTYVEERYGRNLSVKVADAAKLIVRRRIAGVLGEESNEVAAESLIDQVAKEISDGPHKNGDVNGKGMDPENTVSKIGKQVSSRGVAGLSEEDVFLFPCAFGDFKSVQYGFPYLDTLKILQKFGAGVHFLGNSTSEELDLLENSILTKEKILAVFTEFPSNPLCKSADLVRLRAMADAHGFLIVVDETIANFVNVEVLEYADVVCSSLTKIFSGDSNVMGGSAVLNAASPHYQKLSSEFRTHYEDLVWCEDALFLERNSRDFRRRALICNENAEFLVDFLKSRPEVKEVHYPKYCNTDIYTFHKRPDGGYGSLFSVVFKDNENAVSFYDALRCAKGPSLGTNFTLASPYAILAHFDELDWAEGFGVSRWLRHQTHRAINSVIETEEVLGPLPAGWLAGKTPAGRDFYVDQSTKTVTWVDPRSKLVREHDITKIKPGVLPYGWEEAVDKDHVDEVYYIDHTTQTTYREPPWNPSVQQYVIALKRHLTGELKPAAMMKELATAASQNASRRATVSNQQQPVIDSEVIAAAKLSAPQEMENAVQQLLNEKPADQNEPETEAMQLVKEPPAQLNDVAPKVTEEPQIAESEIEEEVSPATAVPEVQIPNENQTKVQEVPETESPPSESELSVTESEPAEPAIENKIAELAKINARLEEEAHAVQEENKHAHEELEAVKAQLHREAEERKKLETLVFQLQHDVLGIVARRGSKEEASVAKQIRESSPFSKPSEAPVIEVAEEDEGEAEEEDEGEDEEKLAKSYLETETPASTQEAELAALKQRLEQEKRQNQTLQMATSSMADAKKNMEDTGEYKIPGWVKQISKSAANSKTVRIKIKEKQKMHTEDLTFADKMLYFTAESADAGSGKPGAPPKAVTSLATPITKGTRKIKGPKETAAARRLQLSNLQQQFTPTDAPKEDLFEEGEEE
ncbi:hypothetical protein HDU93_000570 [Gonapodya sp. JEL0774]|nr:hypothetical protein HDU93_000570 [Gonapodya sp. JEL0774]